MVVLSLPDVFSIVFAMPMYHHTTTLPTARRGPDSGSHSDIAV
jgi:hypothetical protein